jgi:hypothetical protein
MHVIGMIMRISKEGQLESRKESSTILASNTVEEEQKKKKIDFCNIQDRFIFATRQIIIGQFPNRVTKDANKFLKGEANVFVQSWNIDIEMYQLTVNPYNVPRFVCD